MSVPPRVTSAGQARPLQGRRLFFVGIGGSGLSAYANLAHGLGAEVAGWEARDTIFLRSLADGIQVNVGGEPSPPTGFEPIVSTAHAHRISGTSREAFLADVVAGRPAIVVAGAHGKTTTAAMITFALRELGQDPAWVIGGIVPQLGGNAGVGSGWLVVEGDESDRSLFALAPRIAAVTNIELDHHAAYGSEADLRTAFTTWLAGIPTVILGWELEPFGGELALPGRHNRLNAALALETLVAAGADRDAAAEAVGAFTGVERRFQLVGEEQGVLVYDDYGHNPTELRATLETARARTDGRLVAIYQPHVYERTRQLHAELGAALGLADVAIVTEVTGARDVPREGVSGRLVLDSVPDPARRVWAPTLADASSLALGLVRPGDVVVTLGVGEPWKVAEAIVGGLRS